jgi:hypothetical protein
VMKGVVTPMKMHKLAPSPMEKHDSTVISVDVHHILNQ